MQEEYAKIAAIIAEQLRIDLSAVREDSLIVEELGADSVDIVEILTALEDRYQLTVEDEEIASLKTPGDILAYIAEQHGS